MSNTTTEGLGSARALFSAKNYDGAIRILRKMLETDSDNATAAELMVEVLLEKGDAKAAGKLCSTWIAGSAENLGWLVNEMGIEPHIPIAWQGLAQQDPERGQRQIKAP